MSGPAGAVIGYAVSNPDGDDGGPLTDYDLIATRSSQLEQSGIRVYFGSEKSSSANIVLVTGSLDAALQGELDKMLTDGLLENKILVLLSCYSGACELSQDPVIVCPLDASLRGCQRTEAASLTLR